MKIKKIEIKNFRSLDEVFISFVDDLMCIVGRNDVGKSNVIKAMETFFSNRSFEYTDFPFNSKENIVSEITVQFYVGKNSLDEYSDNGSLVIRQSFRKNSRNITKTVECLKEFKEPKQNELTGYSDLKRIGSSLGIPFPSKKPSQDKIKDLEEKVLNKIEELKGTKQWVDITKQWTDIQMHLPEIILIPAAQDPENEQKMSTDSTAFGSLFRVGMRKLLKYDQEGKEAVSVLESKMNNINNEILQIVEEKLKTQGNKFSLVQEPAPLDVAKSFSFQMDVVDEYGVKTPLTHRGNGLQRSVLMAIIRAQSEINKKIKRIEEEFKKSNNENESEEEVQNYFYLIEEPEAFLHLSAQRELYYSIKELIKDGSQALITTHSTLFMDESDVDQVVLLHREEGKTLSTQALDIDDVKENIGEIVQISQLMTGKVCCLVEGISDLNAFKIWFNKLGYSHKELGIYFIDMKGCQNAEYYANVKVIKDFNVPFLVVLDTDFHSNDRADTIKKKLIHEYKVKDHQIVILKKGEIENYFPIEKVEEVLGLDKNSINKEEYQYDPKEAIKKAKEITKNDRAKKYKESRDSTNIARAMEKEEIDEEIVDIIHRLVKLAGGNILEG